MVPPATPGHGPSAARVNFLSRVCLGVGGVGCSSTPGRPSTIENDFTAACAQYVSTPRKRKSAWCPRHATRRQPAPSRTCGPGSTRLRESSIRKQHASDAATIPRGSGAGAVTRSSRPAPDYPCELVRVARVFGCWTSRVYPTPSSQCHANPRARTGNRGIVCSREPAPLRALKPCGAF